MKARSLVPLVVSIGAALSWLPCWHARGRTPLVGSSLAVVDSVKEGSFAAKAGLKVGDLVVSLNGAGKPALETLLAYRFDWESARGSELIVSRGRETAAVTLPQGIWECAFRPDFSEMALNRWRDARAAFEKEETHPRGRVQWEALSEEAAKAGFPGAASWLALELGKALGERRDWMGSEEILRKLLDTAPESSFWRLAASLALAEALARKGEPERAFAAYEEARSLARASGSEIRLAEATDELSRFELRRGRLPEATKLGEEALAIRERLAPESLAVAASLNGLGVVASKQGDLPAARSCHLRAMAIRERQAPGGLDLAGSLNNLGTVAINQGDLAAAREYLLKAMIIKERLAPESIEVANSLTNLGRVARGQGDLAAAREYHLRALAIKQRLAPGSLTVAGSLNNLGTVALSQGDFAAARELHLRALAISERLAPESLDVAANLNNLGMVAKSQGDLPAAREYHLKALAIKERLAPGSLGVAGSFVNLGLVALGQGDLEAAREHYLGALAIQERLAPGSLDVARCLNNLGAIASKRGDEPGARDYHLRALAIRERLAPGSLDEATSLNNLGLRAMRQGDMEAARDYHLRALAIRERLAPGSLDEAGSLRDMAEVERVSGNLPERLALLKRSADALETQRGRVGGPSAKSTFAAAQGGFYSDLISAYMDAGKPELALETLERSRARSLLEMVSSRWIDFSGEVSPALLERQRDLARQRKELSDRLSGADAKTDPKDIEAWRSGLLMLPQKEDALAEEIRKAMPRLASLEYAKPLDYRGISDSLGPGTLLLAYAVNEEETILFALLRGDSPTAAAGNARAITPPKPGPAVPAGARPRGPSRLVARRLPVGAKDLENRARALRARLGSDAARSVASGAWEEAARSLYETLLGPASGEIASSSRILILPDGPLHALPFGVLIPPPKKMPQGLVSKPIGLQRPICIEPSMTVYSELKPARGPGAWIGLGDPVYPGGEPRGEADAPAMRGPDLRPLPWTRKEIETIAALFGQKSRSLLGPEATEGAVRTLRGEVSFVHFACHGLIDHAFPMNSGLALTAPPPGDLREASAIGDNREDGLLQAWEILQDVRLDSDCVVLSACESGMGKILGGEGIMGLTRAFFYSGSRSVVVSLWPISDESTALLMEAFYREILAGEPRDVALMRAQVKLSGSSAFSHPFFWAAFGLHGRP